MTKFDGSKFINYNTTNSGLPHKIVNSIAIDGRGNKWLATEDGIAVFNEGGIVSVVENQNQKSFKPNQSVLYQNYPNPFNSETSISYTLQISAQISINIYNITGQLVRTLVDDKKQAGFYSLKWDGRDETGNSVSSGIYFSRLESGNKIISGKMLLIK